MTRISTDGPGLTLVNVFRAPGRCDALVDCLVTATRQVMRRMPGFVSANFHVSEDRDRVVNYAQWRSRADFDAMRAHPEAAPHMAEAAAIAESFEPILCTVVSVETAGAAD